MPNHDQRRIGLIVPSISPRTNRYLKEIGGSMAAYTAMVAVSVWLVKGHLHSPLRYLFAALPVIKPKKNASIKWAASSRMIADLKRQGAAPAPLPSRAIAFSFLWHAASTT